MKSTVYLETTIIGYFTSRPSRDLVTAANQQLTRDWWDYRRKLYDLYVSEAVIASNAALEIRKLPKNVRKSSLPSQCLM